MWLSTDKRIESFFFTYVPDILKVTKAAQPNMVLSFIPLKDDQKLPGLLYITANLTTLLNPTCGTKDKTLYVRIHIPHIDD